MSSQLSAVSISTRRRAAALSGFLALVLLVAGVLPWTAPAPLLVRTLATITAAVGIVCGLVASGLYRSTSLDVRRRAEAELDQKLMTAAGGLSCDCGHEHNPAAHDHKDVSVPPTGTAACGAAADDCTHTCDGCVLASLR